jgi:hypothetical protein
MNENAAAPAETKTPLTRRALAAFVLLIAGWLLLHFIIHIAIVIVTVIVVIAAVVGVLWALNTLL